MVASVEPTSSFEQIHPGHFVQQKEKDLYFVMERVCKENQDFWGEFSNNLSELSRERAASSQDIIEKNMQSGAFGLRESFVQYILQSQNLSFEFWIFYASLKPVSKEIPASFDTTEMVCTASTTKDAPFVSHMGITRIKRLHSNISVPLHSFAAQVMAHCYPLKVYVLTTPMPHMEKIFRKAMGQNLLIGYMQKWPSDREETRKEIERRRSAGEALGDLERQLAWYEEMIEACGKNPLLSVSNSSFTLKDMKGAPLLDLPEEEMNSTYRWYFQNSCTISSFNNLVAIPIQALAQGK